MADRENNVSVLVFCQTDERWVKFWFGLYIKIEVHIRHSEEIPRKISLFWHPPAPRPRNRGVPAMSVPARERLSTSASASAVRFWLTRGNEISVRHQDHHY